MEKFFVVLTIVFAVLFLCSLAAILIMLSKNQRKISELEENTKIEFERGKQESAYYIRKAFDKILDDKEKLSQMNEKELMIETMLALGSYGRRLDRIESSYKL